MNILSESGTSQLAGGPVMALEYREVCKGVTFPGPHAEATPDPAQNDKPARVSLSEEELAQRLLRVAEDATRETETRLRQEHQKQIEAEQQRVTQALAEFQTERAEYYNRVEPELVNLILAVAARILHREAEVDRMLLAALAKVAVENLQQRSHVVVRVAPDACAQWREYFVTHLSGTKVEVLEDSQLESDGCVLETELGTADVSIDAQLKEIERGFFDLLAKRPEPR
jgi:flagellar assembly protein FliH